MQVIKHPGPVDMEDKTESVKHNTDPLNHHEFLMFPMYLLSTLHMI